MGTEFMNLQFDDLQFNYIISYQYSITTHSNIHQFYTVIFSLYLTALPNIHPRHHPIVSWHLSQLWEAHIKQHPSVIISYNNQVTSGLYSVENSVPGTAVLAQTLEVSPEIEVNDFCLCSQCESLSMFLALSS